MVFKIRILLTFTTAGAVDAAAAAAAAAALMLLMEGLQTAQRCQRHHHVHLHLREERLAVVFFCRNTYPAGIFGFILKL